MPEYYTIMDCRRGIAAHQHTSVSRRCLLLEETILKDKQIDHCARDIGIGNIEHRTEEVAIATNEEAKEVGAAIPLEEWQVHHIDDLTHQQSAILRVEQETIENAVDHIANRTSEDKHSAHNDTRRHLAATLEQVVDTVDDGANHTDTEEAEDELTPVDTAIGRTELHTEGKAIILNIAEVEPREYLDALTHLQIEVNKHLNNLIDNDQQQHP